MGDPVAPLRHIAGHMEALDWLDILGTTLGMAEKSNSLALQLLDGGTGTPEQHRELREALTHYHAGVQETRATLTMMRRHLLRGEDLGFVDPRRDDRGDGLRCTATKNH